MTESGECAGRLTAALELTQPPVAVSLEDEIPAGIAAYDGVVPAGCVFWQEAATRSFATSARDHELCSIGEYTHHLSPDSTAHQSELQETLKAMSELDYVRPDEIAAIPVVQRNAKHVIYGPLAEFPVDPEVVLLFADGQQGLVMTEAVARVDGGTPPAMGRPACAAIPQVINSGRAALSMGCCGARAYLDALPDSLSMWALPADKLVEYCLQIEALASANKTLTMFHEGRRRDVEAGERPTVQESLERLA